MAARARKGPETGDDTRARIIEAAGSVFAEAGFQLATVREICSRAGVNVAAVNYHFGDKLGLYVSVLGSSIIQEEDLRATIATCRTPEETLRALVKGLFTKLQAGGAHANYVRIMAHEMANPSPGLADVVEHVIRPRYTFACTVIAAVLRRKPEESVTRMCAHSLIGQILHYAHARAVIAHLWPELSKNPRSLEHLAEHVANFTLAGLLVYQRPTPASRKKVTV